MPGGRRAKISLSHLMAWGWREAGRRTAFAAGQPGTFRGTPTLTWRKALRDVPKQVLGKEDLD
ncbi:MAG: hypothetical protein ACE5HK_04715 [Candidatus Methylomirabilales bacterium]